MLKRVPIKSQDVKVGDMLFTGATVSRVTSFEPYPEFHKLCPGATARIARVDTGRDMTLIDGDTCEIQQYVIDGLVYFDKHSHDADVAKNAAALKQQIQHNPQHWI